LLIVFSVDLATQFIAFYWNQQDLHHQ